MNGVKTVPLPSADVVPGRRIVLVALLAVYLIWSPSFLGVRFALETFPPFMLSGLRLFLAGAILYIAMRLRGYSTPGRAEWAAAAVIGALVFAGGQSGSAFAQYRSVPSSLAAVGIATTPLWTALLAGVLGQWPLRREWFGLGLGFTGVLLLGLGSDLQESPIGAIALLLSALSWSIGSVILPRLPLPPVWMATAAQMLVGGFLLLIVSVVTGEQLEAPVTAEGLAVLAYLTLLCSMIGFGIYMFVSRHARPTVANSHAYVNPILAVVLGVGFAGERLTFATLLSIPLVLTGAGLIILESGRR